MGFVDRIMPNTYKIQARWFPAIMIALPAIVLFSELMYRFVLQESIKTIPLKMLGSIFSVVVTIGVVSIILFSEKIRNRGKCLEDEYFSKTTAFPTTEFLLWSNSEIEPEVKKLLYEAIFRDFGMSLCSCKEEVKDIAKARRLICFAVNLIRDSVKDGRLLIDYNIRYGYYRNILGVANWGLGCAIVSLVISLVLNSVYIFIVELIFVFYFARLLCKRETILDESSREYAHRLFSEYLTWSNERMKIKLIKPK